MAEQIPSQQGRIVVVQVANPGVGIDWAYVMPIRTRWRLRSVQAQLTTSVNIANRLPELNLSIGGIDVLRISSSQFQAASLIMLVGWMEGERALGIAGQTARVSPLPRGYLLNDQAEISVITLGMDAADEWINIVIVAEEWIEPLA